MKMILSQEKILKLISVFFAELLGTAILLFIGCLGCVDRFENFHPTHLTITLGFGFAVMIALNVFGCVSGAHINPAVTLTAVIYKLVDIPVSFYFF
jgi:aquaporin related protein